MPDEIRFYRADKEYGWMSNLSHCSVIFDGRTFQTAEHAYQWGKPSKVAVKEWLIAAPSPALLAMAAHALPVWDVVPNWADIKLDRMRAVVLAKFEQHMDLALDLHGTGDARIVETGTTNNAVNRFWGEVNGKGENWLGKILMETRDKLRVGR